MDWRSNLLRSRIAQGTAMGLYGFVVQMAIQLASVPLFTAHWGIEGYGVWLMLFGVPALLNVADFGLTTAGANSMLAAAATGEHDRAARIYASLRIITAITSLALALIAFAVLFVFWNQVPTGLSRFSADSVRTAIMILIFYGIMSIINGVTLAGFRAADEFASSGVVFQTIILAEAAAAFTVLYLGHGIVAVAATYLVVRLVGSLVLTLLLRRRAPWLNQSGMAVAWSEVRQLSGPALAAFVLPGANVTVYQGSIMAIGAVAGPAAIPAFSVARTLSRTILQLLFRVNTASMPRYTVADAQGDKRRAADLVLLNLLVVPLFVIPSSAFIVLFGQDIVRIWTAGKVPVELPMLLAVAAAMIANSLWLPLSNLLLSINRHASYSYAYLVFSVAAVGAGILSVREHGALSMAVMVVGMEIVMTVWVIVQSIRYGILDIPELLEAARRLAGWLRRKAA